MRPPLEGPFHRPGSVTDHRLGIHPPTSRPCRVAPPANPAGPPRIRTCRIPASGSSTRGLAASWSMHRSTTHPCDALSASQPLPVEVAVRGHHEPVVVLVPSDGSANRCRPLLDRVPQGRFPGFFAPIAALRLPALPALLCSALDLAVVVLRRQSVGSPKFLDCPLPARPALRPRRGGRPCLLRDDLPTLGRFAVAFRQSENVGHRLFQSLEARSHGSQARCLRFAATVTRLLPYCHARLASGWRHPLAGRDRYTQVPQWAATKVSVLRLPLSPSFAWRT